MQSDGRHFRTFGAQPVGALFPGNFNVGAIFGQPGFEAAGAAVGENGVDAEQDEDFAVSVGGGHAVLLGDQFTGVGSQFFRAAPLVVADVGGHVAFGEGGDEVVGQNRHAFGVGRFNCGDGRVGADGVDRNVLHAFFQQLLNGGDKGGKVALGGGRLHVNLPAEFAGAGGRAVNHGHVEGAGQRRRHKTHIRFAGVCSRSFLFGLFGRFGFFFGLFRRFGFFCGFGFFFGRFRLSLRGSAAASGQQQQQNG